MDSFGEVCAWAIAALLIGYLITSIVEDASRNITRTECKVEYNVSECVTIIVPNTEKEFIEKYGDE